MPPRASGPASGKRPASSRASPCVLPAATPRRTRAPRVDGELDGALVAGGGNLRLAFHIKTGAHGTDRHVRQRRPGRRRRRRLVDRSRRRPCAVGDEVYRGLVRRRSHGRWADARGPVCPGRRNVSAAAQAAAARRGLALAERNELLAARHAGTGPRRPSGHPRAARQAHRRRLSRHRHGGRRHRRQRPPHRGLRGQKRRDRSRRTATPCSRSARSPSRSPGSSWRT